MGHESDRSGQRHVARRPDDRLRLCRLHVPGPEEHAPRPAILVTAPDGANLLVDTPPEMRLQMLQNHVRRLDAVLYTHSHADHIFGLDDVRVFNYRSGLPMPVYAEPGAGRPAAHLRLIFVPTQAGGGSRMGPEPLTPGVPLTLHGLEVLPLRVCHGRLPVLAFLFGGASPM